MSAHSNDEKKYDLTGRMFGRLTAVRCVDGQQSKAVWECRCECGNVKQMNYHNLTQGCTKSCGCSRSAAQTKDLTGQRFGRLAALENTGQKKGSCFLWRCRCDCGRESVHSVNALQGGRVNSCGCLKRENDALKRSLHYVDNTCIEFIEDTKKLRSDNTSGCRGLKLVRGKWQARIGFKKKSYYLGQYSDKEEAIRVRRQAEEAVYGEFLDWYAEQFPERKTRKQAAAMEANTAEKEWEPERSGNCASAVQTDE